MDHKIKPILLVLILILTTAAGFALNYFELPAYAVVLGFRFHIGCFLPFLFVVRKIPLSRVKNYFSNPEYKTQIAPIFWLVIPIFITALLFFTGILELTDPDYFYEFGVSSIIDYPLYLIWNFLQLSMLFMFLQLLRASFTANVILSTISVIFLFSYEVIPFDIAEINYLDIASLILFAAGTSLIIRYFPNIYWFVISVFSSLWFAFLLFGTSSSSAIQNLLGAKYSSWEGFFTAGKEYDLYLIPAYILLVFLLIIISIPLRRKTEVNFTAQNT